MAINKVRFLVDPKPSGNLYERRKHARRVTPYPEQMQALIDAQLLTASAYDDAADRRILRNCARREAIAEAERAEPHVLRQLWQAIKGAVGCA